MANRFWGETPLVQYKAPSLQETAWGPMQLKGQEDALRTQVDAMDEAKMTLEGALGKYAPKQDEFNKAYQEVTARIAKEGATPTNIDRAKQVKNLYAQHVLPMQQFAKAREEANSIHSKLLIDDGKIIQGRKPIDVTFDEWQKDPSSLMAFKAVDKNDIVRMAAEAGTSFGKAFSGPDESLVGSHGIMQWVEGAKSPEDHLRKMSTNENYRNTWNSKKQAIAQSAGVDLSDPRVDALITSTMESKVVGNVQPISMSKAQLDALRGVGPSAGGFSDGPGLLNASKIDAFPNPEMDRIELARRHSGVNSKAQEYLKKIGSPFTFDEIYNESKPGYGGNQALDQRNSISRQYEDANFITAQGPKPDYKRKASISEYRKMLDKELEGNEFLKTGVNLDYDTISQLVMDEKIAKKARDYKDAVSGKMSTEFQYLNAANDSDSKLFNDIKTGDVKLDPDKGIEFKSLQVRGLPDRDKNQSIVGLKGGVGDYVILAKVNYLNGKTKDHKLMQLRVTPDIARDALRIFSTSAKSNSDISILTDIANAISNYSSIITQE